MVGPQLRGGLGQAPSEATPVLNLVTVDQMVS